MRTSRASRTYSRLVPKRIPKQSPRIHHYPTHVPKLPFFAIPRSCAHLPGLSCTLKLLALLAGVLGATVEHAYAKVALAAASMFVVPHLVHPWHLVVTVQ
jgi:hypothetical protein